MTLLCLHWGLRKNFRLRDRRSKKRKRVSREANQTFPLTLFLQLCSMNNDAAIESAAGEMGLILTKQDPSGWIEELVLKINSLLTQDFDKLISILYRMDVSEIKLRQLLNDNPAEDAAKLIAELMIERQAEKIRSRQQFSKRDNDIDEKEKW